MKVDGQEQLPDTLENAKFTSMAWTHDNKGLFYNVRTTYNFFIIKWLSGCSIRFFHKLLWDLFFSLITENSAKGTKLLLANMFFKFVKHTLL